MSPTVVALPSLIELRSQYDKKLLRCVNQEEEFNDHVQFNGDQVGRADVKFEVESSTTRKGLVHIRSCYNNKYLVLNKYDLYIVAKAEKPEEDHSKRSCTLLRPTSVDGNPKNIRLTIVHLENNLCAWQPSQRVLASYSDPDEYSCDVFNVIDWQSLVLLPKYIAFKGDNDKFLGAYSNGSHEYLQFSKAHIEDHPMLVGNEIVQTTNVGNIRIRNLHCDKYWRLSPNWIWTDSTTPTSDDTLFEPVKINDDTIALRNVANKLFCTRLTIDGKENCLNACSSTINKWTKFKVSELIISRKTENIQFRLMDARIHRESPDVMVSASHTNNSSTTEEQTLNLSYTDKKSSTWNSNISMKATFEASFEVGLPLILDGQVKIGAEISGSYVWGETTEEEKTVSKTYKVSVPPKTKVTVRLVANRGTCDVPFSYTQRDVLYTGETVTTQMDDGVYTGVNNYNFDTETKEEPLQIEHAHVANAGFKKAKVSPSGLIMIPT